MVRLDFYSGIHVPITVTITGAIIIGLWNQTWNVVKMINEVRKWEKDEIKSTYIDALYGDRNLVFLRANKLTLK